MRPISRPCSSRSTSSSTRRGASCSPALRKLLRPGGRIVSVAEEALEGVAAVYFVVEPDRTQLASELAGLVDEGHLRLTIDSVFPLDDVRAPPSSGAA